MSSVVKSVAPCADVFSNGLFGFGYRAILIDKLETHVDSDVVPRVLTIVGAAGQRRFVDRGQFSRRIESDVVTLPRFRFTTRRRALSDEGDANFKNCFVTSGLTLEVPHDSPDSILIFNVIKHAELARHWNRHVEQAAFLSGPFECKACAKGRHVHESRDLGPIKVGSFAAMNSHWKLQCQPLSNSFPVSFLGHVRQPGLWEPSEALRKSHEAVDLIRVIG